MSTFVTKYAKEKGLEKVDATEPLTVRVLPRDISKALVKDSTCCAFARAAKRRGAESAVFFRSVAWLESDGLLIRYLLPPSVQKEIVSFDRAKVMAPGVYQLTPPLQVHLAARHRQAQQEARRPPHAGRGPHQAGRRPPHAAHPHRRCAGVRGGRHV